MGYVERHLLAGEHVLYKTRLHWILFLRPALLMLIGIALGVACRKNADIPASAARTLCDQRNRPEGLLKLPEECRPFYELMQMAKLVPRD